MYIKQNLAAAIVIAFAIASTVPATQATSISTPGNLPKSVGVAISKDGDAASVMAECDLVGFACAGAAAFTAEVCATATGAAGMLGLEAWGEVEVCTDLYASAGGSVMMVLTDPDTVCRDVAGDEVCDQVVVPLQAGTGVGEALAIGYTEDGGSELLDYEAYGPWNGCAITGPANVKTCAASAKGATDEFHCIETRANAQTSSMGFSTAVQEADGVSNVVDCAQATRGFALSILDLQRSESRAAWNMSVLPEADQVALVQAVEDAIDINVVGDCSDEPAPLLEDGLTLCDMKVTLATAMKEGLEPAEWNLDLVLVPFA